MTTKTLKKAVALTGTIAMVGAGLAPCVQAFGAEGPGDAATIEAAAREGGDASALNAVDRVEGVFSFNQDGLTETESISRVFVKAAATLCASLPEDSARTLSQIAVESGTGHFVVTPSEADGDQAASRVIGCACSTNVAGGGAIMNALISGVSMQSIALQAGVAI